jgi:hypothetical protein
MMNWKGYGKSSHGQIEGQPKHLPRGTKENYTKSQSGQLTSWIRFELSTFPNTHIENYCYISPFRTFFIHIRE